VQRLFSTFASGWPGIGLLLLRLLAAAALLRWGVTELDIVRIVGAAAGVLLLIGLGTPVAGSLVACVGIWIAYSGHGDLWTPLLLAALGAALAMIGPGAWSIDARLFGRKHFDLS
jgi:uncharacterized membrane protein YphA (DoxX/SURF4 family)